MTGRQSTWDLAEPSRWGNNGAEGTVYEDSQVSEWGSWMNGNAIPTPSLKFNFI